MLCTLDVCSYHASGCSSHVSLGRATCVAPGCPNYFPAEGCRECLWRGGRKRNVLSKSPSLSTQTDADSCFEIEIVIVITTAAGRVHSVHDIQ